MNKLIFFLYLSTVILIYGAEPPYPQSLENQPKHIVLQIMEQLPDKDLISFAQTSKKYRDIAQQCKMQKMLQQREFFKSKIQGTYLNLGNMNLTYIIPGVFDDPAFNNLQDLFLENNKLTTLSTNTFNGLNNLIWLSLFNNQLTTLPVNIFNDCLYNLQWIFLSNNQLTSLAPIIFKNLKALIRLSLFNNPLDEQTKLILNQLTNKGVMVSY